MSPASRADSASVQVPRVLREVRLRGRLDPVCLVSVVDLVQVRRQDALLRPRAVELRRQARLLHLPLHGPLPRDVEVAHELLRDRRPALHDRAGADVGDGRSRDALDVDAAVLEEATVLDRDRRLADPERHLIGLDGLTVSLGRNRSEQRAVGRVQERVLADADRPQRAQVARGPVGEHRGSASDPGCGRNRQDRDHADDSAVAPPLPSNRALMATSRAQRVRIERGSPAGRRAHGEMLASAIRVFLLARGAAPRTPRRVAGLRAGARAALVRRPAERGRPAGRPRVPLRRPRSPPLIQYGLMLGILLLIARGLPRRELFALRRPASWPRALGLAVLALLAIYLAAFVYEQAARAVRRLEPDRRAGPRARGLGLEPGGCVRRLLPRRDVHGARGRGADVPRARHLADRSRGASRSRSSSPGFSSALAHGLLVALPILAIFGIVVGWLRVRTNSIYPPMALHAAFNGIALIASVSGAGS